MQSFLIALQAQYVISVPDQQFVRQLSVDTLPRINGHNAARQFQ